MSCTQCGGDRFANVNGKCSDLSFTDIPHLDLEHDGYVPSLGVGSGDYVEVSFCLDCGQIPNWKPVTDEMILEMEEFGGGQTDDDNETGYDYREARRHGDMPALDSAGPQPKNPEPTVFSMVNVEMQRISQIMQNSYGPAWIENAEAREILTNTLTTNKTDKPLNDAVKQLLGIK